METLKLENYKISNIDRLGPTDLNHGVFLVLFNVRNIPPHLYLCVNGKLFSTSINGPSIDMDAERMVQIILRKKVGAIFVKLALPDIMTMSEIQEQAREITLQYNRVDLSLHTCLSPIRHFCHEMYETEIGNVSLIFDLLNQLQSKEKIAAFYHLNLEEDIRNHRFLMPTYTMFEIQESIHKAMKR